MKNLEKSVEDLIEILSSKEQTVSFAESCTGGRIASAFTAVSGSSNILYGSCVTYANKIKEEWLGVPKEILETKGAVSQECVEYMLRGMQKMASSDYTLAVSGIAGPTGGTELKPVGTVYIGLLTPDGNSDIHHCLFKGDRHQVQEQATRFAIELLEKNVK
ncbi:CinA family protein [Sulfurovum mangrovi]|uniref:CinA family protein n=1 Tax=Sulfurovum mangrovi TaxID=2893889 RepID=UPI001E4F00D5|nr:CinA family protein [Sulfurovum mangrovi]UFH58704.1 CinA family protein [Sulfurovum mangrovi]